MPNVSYSAAIVCLLCLVSAVGCSDGRPQRVPVAGQVLIDGQPLTHGFVRFFNEHNRAATGELDSAGHFRLSCYTEFDGAVLGAHDVAVMASERLNDTQMKWHAPKKYADPELSMLTQEISGPTDSIVIDLTWDGGKPFIEGDPPPARDAKDPSLPAYISR